MAKPAQITKILNPMNNKLMNTVYSNIRVGIDKKVLHLSSTPTKYADGRTIYVEGNALLNFASYSYLGLEVDPRLIEGGVKTIKKYGTQFGASRAYVSIDLYQELESLLAELFGALVIVAPSTTLAHQAALPVLIGDKDYVILDQQVHASVKTSVDMLKARGIPVEIIRHNRLDALEERIVELRKKYEHIWYMPDGVYSMYGDFAPLGHLKELMDTYDQFEVYIDDAHGMSWTGINGVGYVLSQMKLHPQMTLVTSLNKGFAGAGGVIVTSSFERYDRMKTCGGTLIFSTPIQPPMLGVDIASAKIHLSNEITILQDYFKKRIDYCHHKLKELGLPDVSAKESPIFYIATGTPKVSFNLVEKMMQAGFYLSSALFPAVGVRQSGVRFCVNINHSLNDIDRMLEELKSNFERAFSEENVDTNRLHHYFEGILPNNQMIPKELQTEKSVAFKVEMVRTIQDIEKSEWDQLFMCRGSFDWEGMHFLEKVFEKNESKENNWKFYYFIIRDSKEVPILATLFTETWAKEDMFSKVETSRLIEEERANDKYHLASKVLLMGTMLSEGEHLFVDYNHPEWKNAISELVKCITIIQKDKEINQIVFRDFERSAQIKNLLIPEGFMSVDLPNSNIIGKKHLQWDTIDQYLETLSENSKKKVKRHAVRNENYYTTSFVETATQGEIDHWYELYLNIQAKSLEINTYPIPKKIFELALVDPKWDVLKLELKKEYTETDEAITVGIGLIYKTDKTYSPMVLGLDYTYLYTYENYRQAIYQVVKRANALKLETIFMGFTADIEKRNFGAEQSERCAYAIFNDSFNMQVIEGK